MNSKRSGKGHIHTQAKKEILKNPEYLFLNGIRYVGNWKENKFHGMGSFKYLNGDSYEGDGTMTNDQVRVFLPVMMVTMRWWLKIKKDGYGRWIFLNGIDT